MHVWASILTCFWARGPPQGRPRDHAGMEPWKTTKASLFWDPLFGPLLNKSRCFFVMFFCYVFQPPLLPTFSFQRHPLAPIWSPFGYQVDDISNKSGKVATAFSLERGHQNQAFQGLHFMMFHHFLMRVVETCDCHPWSKALFTLSSISGSIWHPIWDSNLAYFALHFSYDFFITGLFPKRNLVKAYATQRG